MSLENIMLTEISQHERTDTYDSTFIRYLEYSNSKVEYGYQEWKERKDRVLLFMGTEF
jgi:hypothetical protein